MCDADDEDDVDDQDNDECVCIAMMMMWMMMHLCVFMCNYEFFFNCVPQSGQFHIVFAVGK